MAGPLLIGAEGVLLLPASEGSYASSRPLSEGIELVMMLMHFPTSRTAIMVATEDTDAASHFAKIQGLKGVTTLGITPEDRTEEPAVAQWNTLQRQRSLGPINLVLTAYREVYERCTATHQPVILFGRRGALGSLDSTTSWEDLHARVVRRRDAAVEEPHVEDQ